MDREERELYHDILAGDYSKIPELDNLYRRKGCNRCPCPECLCLEDLSPEEVFCYDCVDDHWPHSDKCPCSLCDILLYQDGPGGPIRLELHSNRTLWGLDNPEEDWDYYSLLVQLAAEDFTHQTGVDVEFLGRSGRHVCVEDTLENRQNYQQLRELALQIEQGVIKSFNEEMASRETEDQ